MSRRWYRLLAVAIPAFVGCSAATDPGQSRGVFVATIGVAPSNTLSLHLGDSVRVIATPRDAAGQTLLSVPCTFTAAPSRIATIDATGMVHTFAMGVAQINVTCGNTVVSVPLNVGLSAAAAAVVGTYRLTKVNGSPPPLYLGKFDVTSGADCYVNDASLTLMWDSTTFVQNFAVSVSIMYKGFDPKAGASTWYDNRSEAGAWSLTGQTLSTPVSDQSGNFAIAKSSISGKVITLTVTSPSLFIPAGNTALMELTKQ